MRYVARKPYSLRLDAGTVRRLAEDAARLRMPARTLAQQLVEEGLRTRRHPIIRFVDRPGGRRAGLVRRPRLSVGNIVQTVRGSVDLDEAARYLDLPLADVEKALDYYAEFRDEVDAEIAEHERIADQEERAWRERQRSVRTSADSGCSSTSTSIAR